MKSVDGVRFEFFTAEVLDDLMRIELEAYPEPWTRGMFQDELRSRCSRFFVAYQDAEVIGYGGFWLILDEAHITSVTIRRSDRGKGWGRKLFVFLLEQALQEGARTATLEVRQSNEPARALYRSLGFSEVGIRKGYYPRSGEDAVVMMRELHPVSRDDESVT